MRNESSLAIPAVRGEAERLSAVGALMSIDVGSDLHIDEVCRTAAGLFEVPIAIVTLVDESTVWVKGANSDAKGHVPRADAFCDETIALSAGDALVLSDLESHPRFKSSSLVVGEPHARFYAGVPIVSGAGYQVGTMCVMDIARRGDFGARQIAQLQDLAKIVQDHFRLHETRLAREEEEGRRLRAEAVLAERDATLLTVNETQTIAETTARFGHWCIHGEAWTVSWSQGIARILDREMPEDDILDLDVHLAFYHPDDRARMRRRIREALAERNVDEDGRYAERAKILRPDGEIRDVVIEGAVRRDVEGRVSALHGVMLDITDLSQAERQARETSEQLRATLEHMDQGLVMLGPDGHVRVHNRRARDLLDVPANLLRIGAPFDPVRRFLVDRGDFLDADVPAREWAEVGGLEREPRIYQRRCTNGASLEIRAVPLPDGGVVRTMTDISLQRRIETMIQDSERRYRLLAENATDVIIHAGLDTIRRYVSPACKQVFGYEPEELIGTKAFDFVHPDDLASFAMSIEELVGGLCEKSVWCQRYAHRDGTWVWIEASASLTRDADGAPDGYVVCLRDIADRKAVEDALRDSEERLALALDSGSDGVWDLNIVTGDMRVSGAWVSLMGYRDDEMPRDQASWHALTHPDDAARLEKTLTGYIEGNLATFECEYRLRNKSGDWVWTLARGKVVGRDARGRAVRVVGTNIDVTRRKEADRLIAHMAVHDGLTGLPNRTLFKDRLEQIAADGTRRGGFAILACDLDGFKAVNDSLGHPTGDAVLKTIAQRLTSVLGGRDTAARLGGDEFALIISELDDPSDAAAIAQLVIERVGEPVEIDGRSTSVGVSIGIAWGTGTVTEIDALFKNADVALYRAKEGGGNTFRYFEIGMDAKAAKRGALANDLRAAIRTGAFTLEYQPIIDLKAKSVRCLEALLRWTHPEHGRVPPDEFIPLAEQSGLIVSIGEWVLREACVEAATWPSDVRIAVNVSSVQFRRPGSLEQTVLAALAISGLSPDRLELEITESVLIQDAEAVLACLHRLRAMGVRIALDDFGTGFSSLSYLRRFPFNKIKIDRSFVADIEDPDTAAIVRAVVGLGARAGASITAEGVETERQLERVREEGCTEVQGFLFSRPLHPADVAKLIAGIQGARVAA